jgi:hypothetical protein
MERRVIARIDDESSGWDRCLDGKKCHAAVNEGPTTLPSRRYTSRIGTPTGNEEM